LVDRLNQTLPEATKRVVLSGEVTEAHVRQLRRVERLEVAYRMGAGGMSARTFNALFDLGPVRKLICIPADATPAQLERVGRLKFYVPVVQVDKQPLSEQLLAWLEGRHKRNNYFILGPDVDPNRIYELTRFRPLHLEFQTRNNRVSEKIMNVIKDLMSVELVIWADGRLTLDDAKRFANLERFGIRVDLGRPPEYTPGLFHLLNRIAPPR